MAMRRGLARDMTRSWWVFLITGIAWFLIALLVLRFDTGSIATVGFLLGALFLLAGLNEFMIGAASRTWRWAHYLLGVFFLIGSLWAFVQPIEAFWALASVLGFLLILKGTMDIVVSTATREANPVWGLGLAAGIIEVLLGFWASQQFFPARATLILIWVGFMALFRGFSEIFLAFQIRHAGKALEAAGA
jgi:uncharacterized membrane protein HdeD (DUF308 family)